MGNCYCVDSRVLQPKARGITVPEAVVYMTDDILCLNYNGKSEEVESFEDFKSFLVDSMIVEVIKYNILTTESNNMKQLIKITGTDGIKTNTSLLIEVYEGRVIMQIGASSVIDHLLHRETKIITLKFKPTITDINMNMVQLIVDLYKAKTEDSPEASTMKQMIKYIKNFIAI